MDQHIGLPAGLLVVHGGLLRRFRADTAGGVFMLVGLGLPVFAGGVTAAVEYGLLIKRRQQLQIAADQAVTTAANQFMLANADETTVKNLAETKAREQARTPSDRTTNAAAVATKKDAQVQISLQETVPTLMGRLLSLPTADIQVTSRAKLVGSVRLCLLALNTVGPGAFHLEKKAQVIADDCSTYSNSSDPKGLQAGDSAVVAARANCSAGGVDGRKANFTPDPLTGCPQLQDPLRDRAAPSVGGCISLSPNANSNPDSLLGALLGTKNEVDQSITLDPGTYCGGLKIKKNAVVTLNPGIYVLKDGPLIVQDKASMTGQNVGFYFMGDKGGMRFDKDTTISLTAPRDGIMAGLLMFEERAVNTPVVPPLDLGVLPAPLPPVTLPKPLRE